MQEYRIVWCKIPTNYNDSRVLFVTAATEADARALAGDHLERRIGVPRQDVVFEAVSEAKPMPTGTVREG